MASLFLTYTTATLNFFLPKSCAYTFRTRKRTRLLRVISASSSLVMDPPEEMLYAQKLCTSFANGRAQMIHEKREEEEELGVLLSDKWNEIQGAHNWSGLLQPIHPLLASEVMRYGVFARCCYDALDDDASCRHSQKSLFSRVGMDGCGYQITKFIYASPCIRAPEFLKVEKLQRSSWVGFVAVTTEPSEIRRLGRRDIVIALRGTATFLEWLSNLIITLTPPRFDPLNPLEDVKVEKGFLGLYNSCSADSDSSCSTEVSCREQILPEIRRLVTKYGGGKERLSITVTGHSMGSALGMLCAYDIAELGMNCISSAEEVPVTVFSFAGPRVGNAAFKERCKDLGIRVLRVVNGCDPVTYLPGIIFNEKFGFLENLALPWCYHHVGVELALNLHRFRCCNVHDLGFYLFLLSEQKKMESRKKHGSPSLLPFHFDAEKSVAEGPHGHHRDCFPNLIQASPH